MKNLSRLPRHSSTAAPPLQGVTALGTSIWAALVELTEQTCLLLLAMKTTLIDRGRGLFYSMSTSIATCKKWLILFYLKTND